ncbi:MAG: endonuclease/exonuclease/phosphatase family protein [Ilumatobacteraceae bacterium]
MSRRREQLAWLTAGTAAVALVSPWVERLRWRGFTVLRSLMPWAALSAAPLAIRAALTGHRRLAVASGIVGVAGLAVAAPLTVSRRQPPLDRLARPLTIVHANLLYINRHITDVPPVIARLDPDIVTFSELTPAHARRLRASSLAALYPYRIELPARAGSGTGLWSRHPVTEHITTGTKHHTVVADVDGPGGVIQVIVMHTQSPIVHHDQWVSDLEQLGSLVPDGPAVMAGDFNASWWHPEMRRLMRRGGWRDAHIDTGHGLSCSWPNERWHALFHWHPPFVRIDHALVNDGVAVLDVTDFEVPGSDHRGLMVTVQRARSATP